MPKEYRLDEIAVLETPLREMAEARPMPAAGRPRLGRDRVERSIREVLAAAPQLDRLRGGSPGTPVELLTLCARTPVVSSAHGDFMLEAQGVCWARVSTVVVDGGEVVDAPAPQGELIIFAHTPGEWVGETACRLGLMLGRNLPADKTILIEVCCQPHGHTGGPAEARLSLQDGPAFLIPPGQKSTVYIALPPGAHPWAGRLLNLGCDLKWSFYFARFHLMG